MERLTIITALILLVFGVLQIILFFKLWGMTNDIRKIKKSITKEDDSEIMREILKGNPNISSILFDATYHSLGRLFSESIDPIPTECDSVISHYKPMYKKAGIDFPDVFNEISSSAAWIDLHKCE